MPIERLVRVLKDVGFDIEPLDVAEIIWLAKYLPAHEDEQNEAPDELSTGLASPKSLMSNDWTTDEIGESERYAEDDQTNQFDGGTEPAKLDEGELQGNNEGSSEPYPPNKVTKSGKTELVEVPAMADLYLPSKSIEQAGGLAFRTTGISALPGKLAYGRALRPLLRGVPSQNQFTLDEGATVHRIADTQVWLPVMRPEQTRWLELEIVVDEWPSIALWRDGIRELITLLTNLDATKRPQIR